MRTEVVVVEHRWLRASKREPCPVCKKPDYCTRSADGTLVCCMRQESKKPSTNKLGGWIHRLDEPLPVVKIEPKREEPPVDWTNEAQRMYRHGDAERRRLSEVLGLKTEALEELMVGMGFDEYRRQSFSSWPERNAAGMVVGIVRRYMDGSKKTMKGSHHGLYYGRAPVVMPGPVYLPEGGSDTAALIGLGVNAIGRPSNTGGIGDLGKMLVGVRKVVVVIGESDRKADSDCPTKCGWCLRCWPGLAGARMTAERLSRTLKQNVLVRLFSEVKDTREWVKRHPGAFAPDMIDALNYDTVREPCRVCGNGPPHERRHREVICVKCRALLENIL